MRKHLLLLSVISLTAFGFGNGTEKKIDSIVNNTDTNISLDPSGGKVIFKDETANRVPFLNATSGLESSVVTDTELGFISGLTSSAQTQLDAKALKATTLTTTAPMLIDAGASADLSANRTLSMPAATTGVDGYLTTTDWNTFNDKTSFSGLTTNCVMKADSATSAVCGTPLIDTANFVFDVGITETTKGTRGLLSLTSGEITSLTKSNMMWWFNETDETAEIWFNGEALPLGGGGGAGSRLNLYEFPSFERGKLTDLVATSSVITEETSIILSTVNNESSAKVVTTGLGDATADKATGAEFTDVQMAIKVWVKVTAGTDVKIETRKNSIDTGNFLSIPNDSKWHEMIIPESSDIVSMGYKVSGTNATFYLDETSLSTIEFQTISSAHFVGSLDYQAANCQWAVTSATYGEFPTDADCNASNIIGSITAPDTKIPALKILNTRSDGTYEILWQGTMLGNTGTETCYYTMSSTGSHDEQGAARHDGTGNIVTNLIGSFRFSDGGDKQVSIIAKRNSGGTQCNLYGGEGTSNPSKFTVTFHPDKTSSIVAQTKQLGHFASNGGTGATTVTNTDVKLPFTTIHYDNLGGGDNVLERYVIQKSGTYKIGAICSFVNPAADYTFNWTCKIFKNGTNIFGATINGDGGNVATVNNERINMDTVVELIEGDYIELFIWTNWVSPNVAANFESFTITQLNTEHQIVGSFSNIETCSDKYECSDTFSGKVLNNGTATIDYSTLSFLSDANVTRTALGKVTIDISSLGLTTAPSFLLTTVHPSSQRHQSIKSISSTTIEINTFDTSNTPNDQDFSFILQKQGPDYSPKSAKVSLNSFVMGSSLENEKVVSVACRIDNNGTPTISTASGLCESWVSSITDLGVGIAQINFTTGTFSSEAVCTCSGEANNRNGIINNPSSTSVECRIQTSTTAALVDGNFWIQCTGKQ